MNTLVKFLNLLEERREENYGILLDNGNIICLCCGGEFEPEDYEIIERDIPWNSMGCVDVAIEVSGGMVQNVYSNGAASVEVYDLDVSDFPDESEVKEADRKEAELHAIVNSPGWERIW